MTQDVSGFGTVVNIVASNTFPQGITITQFADDVDPLDMPSVDMGEVTMGLNGDAIAWSKAVPLPMVLGVIPGGADDNLLQILANNNRVSQGKQGAADIITATVLYPDGSSVIRNVGKIISAPFGKSIATSNRLKSRVYGFKFES